MSQHRAVLLAATVIFAFACGGNPTTTTPAEEAAKTELRMAMAPSGASQTVLTNAQPIADYLGKEIGTPVKVQVPTSYSAIVESLTSNNVEIAWLGALSYVAAHQKNSAEAVTKSGRCPPTLTAAPAAPPCAIAPTYPSIIFCNKKAGMPSNLSTQADWDKLKGKVFVFGDSVSTSASLWPRYYMKKNNINPDKDFSKVDTKSSQTAVALSVYSNDNGCGATFGDARLGAKSTAADIFDKTAVVFVAPQQIPGDPQVVRHNMNSAQKEKIKKALVKLGTDPSMKGPLDKLYNIASMELANDSDYDVVRTFANAVDPNIIGESIKPPASPSPAASKSP
jgi:phosphonate transport system substrate-binding protein